MKDFQDIILHYKIRQFVVIFLSSCIFFGCARKDLSPLEYVKWVEAESHGLNLKKQIGEFEFGLQYKPHDYIALMEKKDENISSYDLNKRVAELGGLDYYTFRISSSKSKEILSAGISSENEYYQRLEYFMSPMQDDISMVIGKDTIPCTLFHFERTYGLTPYCNFVMGFPSVKEENSDRKFIYNDRILGTGNVIININNSDLKNIPTLVTFK
jgi:hypothetical protein